MEAQKSEKDIPVDERLLSPGWLLMLPPPPALLIWSPGNWETLALPRLHLSACRVDRRVASSLFEFKLVPFKVETPPVLAASTWYTVDTNSEVFCETPAKSETSLYHRLTNKTLMGEILT